MSFRNTRYIVVDINRLTGDFIDRKVFLKQDAVAKGKTKLPAGVYLVAKISIKHSSVGLAISEKKKEFADLTWVNLNQVGRLIEGV